jgi:hypothetical protein
MSPLRLLASKKTEYLLADNQLTGINKCSDFSEWTQEYIE